MLPAFRELDDGHHRAEFYRMWATAHDAGFTHGKSLETMGERGSARTEAARQWLLDSTGDGRDLSESVRSHGAPFEELEGALLTLGEESGHLDEALRLLGDFFTKKHQLMLWVKTKAAYPLVTALAACFIAPFPLLFLGHTLAYLAVAFSGVGLLLLGSKAVVAAVAAHYGRKPPLARARMARALATAVQAGLTVPRAVRLAAEASDNARIRNFVGRMTERDLAAASISDLLGGCPHLTPEFAASVATAERTGDFTVLTRLAELYEDGFS